jgi:hypothetical protein
MIKDIERLLVHIEVELEVPIDSDQVLSAYKYDEGFNDGYIDIAKKLKHIISKYKEVL